MLTEHLIPHTVSCAGSGERVIRHGPHPQRAQGPVGETTKAAIIVIQSVV